MQPIDRLLAYEEIRQLVARYALAVDSRDLDALVALFVDDVQVGRESAGRDALRVEFTRTLSEVGVTVLTVGTHVIDLVDAESATGSVYCHGEIEVEDRWVRQAILYRDTYAWRAGHWYFVRRRHELWYGAPAELNPLTLPSANWPASTVGRGTVPECWETWREFRAATGG